MADYDWIIFWLILVVGKLQDKVKSLARKLSSLSSSFSKFRDWVKREIARIRVTLATIIGAAIMAAKDTAKKVVSSIISELKKWVSEKIENLRRKISELGKRIHQLTLEMLDISLDVMNLTLDVGFLKDDVSELEKRVREIESLVSKLKKQDVEVTAGQLYKLFLALSSIILMVDYKSLLREMEPTIRETFRAILADVEKL